MPSASVVTRGFTADEVIRLELAHHVSKEGSREACALQRVSDMHLLDGEDRSLECAVASVDLC